MQFDIGILFLVIGILPCSPITCYQIKYKKLKIVKSVKFHVISGVVSYKNSLIYNIKILRGMNNYLYGVFVSPHGDLGGPPSFLACHDAGRPQNLEDHSDHHEEIQIRLTKTCPFLLIFYI
jgi:hypothetical protein